MLRDEQWERIEPVSYTHLDVYKRQRHPGAVRAGQAVAVAPRVGKGAGTVVDRNLISEAAFNRCSACPKIRISGRMAKEVTRLVRSVASSEGSPCCSFLAPESCDTSTAPARTSMPIHTAAPAAHWQDLGLMWSST